MLKYVVKRLIMIIPTMIVVTFIVFLLINITPADPGRMMLGNEATQEQVDQINHELGYDLPLLQRYFKWLGDALHGDFGSSYYTHRDVLEEMTARLPYTIMLTIISLGIAILIGVPLGVLCSVKQYSIGDYMLSTLAMFLAAMPGFWLALLLLLQFSMHLGWLPSVFDAASWKSWILPVVSLAVGYTASYLRYTRSAMLDNVRQDYIRTARSKGCTEGTITWKHTFRNSLMTLVTITGMTLSSLLGGAIVTESVFSIPGLGLMGVNAIKRKDIPQVMASLVVLGSFFMVIMVVIDIVYAFIDPRIKATVVAKHRKKLRQKAEEERV